MLNFRYHVVSLVAVFLALTIGIIMGTTVIDQALVKDLRRQRLADQKAKTELRADVEARDAELQLWDAFGESILPTMMSGRLRARFVVLVSDAGVDTDLLDAIADGIVAADGRVAGRIAFTDKWSLGSEPAREQLALAAGLSDDAPGDLSRKAAEAIALRLRTPRALGDDDVLRALERAGFLALSDLGAGTFPPANTGVVLATGLGADPVPSFDDVVVPFLRAVAGGMPSVVAEPLEADESIARRVRGDDALRAVVGSVDHVDTAVGRLALVAALQGALARRPALHFGTDDGAAAVAPSARPAPRPSPSR